MRSLRLSLVLLAVSLTGAGALPASAAGHASFLEADPGAGQRVEEAPARIAVAFTEPINARLTRIELTDPDTGSTVATRPERSEGRHIVLRPSKPLTRGAYRVRWRSVSSVDGHVREGYFSFGVATAAGPSASLVAESPLARSGWIRVAARLGLYVALLLFAGGLLLRALLRRPVGESWLGLPRSAAREAASAQVAVLQGEVRVVRFAGGLAVALAMVVALAEGADAVGGLSWAVASDFLTENAAGLARLALPLVIGAALVLSDTRRDGPAALMGIAALGAIAGSGHAAGAASPGLAIASAWVHLAAVAVWLGGLGLIGLTWGPRLRQLGTSGRRVLLRSVLPRFGRIALPSFAVVVVTGAVNSIVELGSLDALWTTSYGRVLLAKIALVLVMAAVSAAHAFRLRPRLERSGSRGDARAERRHWKLLRSEPLLGVGAVAAVAFLVGFPTPPRELSAAEAEAGETRACSPCPVRVPGAGELSVAGWTGKEIVAAWISRDGGGLRGEARIYERTKAGAAPADRALRVREAEQRECGRGCASFVAAGAPDSIRIGVDGRRDVVLPARWHAGADDRARRLLSRAFDQLRSSGSVRLSERVGSEEERGGEVEYLLDAPDRMRYRTGSGMESVTAGRHQWVRPPGVRTWERVPLDIPFRTANWLRSPIFVQAPRLLDVQKTRRGRFAVVAYMDSGTPGWGTAWIDLATGRVTRVRMLVENHRIEHRYFAYDRPVLIELPRSAGE